MVCLEDADKRWLKAACAERRAQVLPSAAPLAQVLPTMLPQLLKGASPG